MSKHDSSHQSRPQVGRLFSGLALLLLPVVPTPASPMGAECRLVAVADSPRIQKIRACGPIIGDGEPVDAARLEARVSAEMVLPESAAEDVGPGVAEAASMPPEQGTNPVARGEWAFWVAAGALTAAGCASARRAPKRGRRTDPGTAEVMA
jgi:hypothetical protein